MTAMQGNIIISMMSCLVVIPIMIVYELPVTIYLFYVPLSVFMAGFLAIGLGMLVAPLNCVQRDIEHLFRFIVRAGFFLSPVMWTYEMALERGHLGKWSFTIRWWFHLPWHGTALQVKVLAYR